MIDIWEMPAGMPGSDEFDVSAKDPGETEYRSVFCGRIFTGHQKGESSPSSLAVFDFDGEADIKVAFRGGPIRDWDIRPHSYGIRAEYVPGENALIFRLMQKEEAPRKMLVRINGGWESSALHLLTNPVEKERPDPFAPNVLRIRSGDGIPDYLPEGKDTYYFDKGIHTLPQGLWAELDLGAGSATDRFEILQGPFSLNDCGTGGRKSEPLKFTLESRRRSEDPYELLYDGTANREYGTISGSLPPRESRFVRLRILGNTAEKGWIFSAVVRGLRLFETGSGRDIALGKAVRGAIPQFANLTDGNPETAYAGTAGNAVWHAGEPFFLSQPGTNVYLAAGAVVRGGFAAEDTDDLCITGRGVLDAGILHHENPDPGEARTGAIWLNGGNRCRIEGITVLDAPMWQIVLNYSRDILVRNINLIGYVVNADGIHFSGCERATAEGCFVRTCDDLIVIYHYGKTSEITIRNCVFLNDDAHVFLFGLGEAPGAVIRDIRIIDCDILSQQEAPWEPYRFSGIVKLWAHGGNTIENILVERMRVDPFRTPGRGCVFQMRTDRRFEGEKPGKGIRDILLKDIFIEEGGESPSLLLGDSEEGAVEGITFENYRREGWKAASVEDLNVTVTGHVGNIAVR